MATTVHDVQGVTANRFRHPARQAGFTMVELIMVIVLAGILAAVAATRFFNRGGFDVSAYAETVRGMARYGQKLAIAQNRTVWMTSALDGAGKMTVALCYVGTTPCPVGQTVPVPTGSNSGSPATRKSCVNNSGYVENWYCEGQPDGVSAALGSGATSVAFAFNGLGRPYLQGDLNASGAPTRDSTFGLTTFTFSADNLTIPVTIYPETGYVN